MPEGLDWDVWRIMASPRFSISSPTVILNEWTLKDLRDAHATLDLYEDLEHLARQRRDDT